MLWEGERAWEEMKRRPRKQLVWLGGVGEFAEQLPFIPNEPRGVTDQPTLGV
jgi:hypothetical protein